MIDRVTAVSAVLRRLEKLPDGHCLDLRTYKRNRSVLLVRRAADDYLVVQDGYDRARYETDLAGLPRLLKTLLKKEFPRSTKIRLYDLGPYAGGESERVPRKTL